MDELIATAARVGGLYAPDGSQAGFVAGRLGRPYGVVSRRCLRDRRGSRPGLRAGWCRCRRSTKARWRRRSGSFIARIMHRAIRRACAAGLVQVGLAETQNQAGNDEPAGVLGVRDHHHPGGNESLKTQQNAAVATRTWSIGGTTSLRANTTGYRRSHAQARRRISRAEPHQSLHRSGARRARGHVPDRPRPAVRLGGRAPPVEQTGAILALTAAVLAVLTRRVVSPVGSCGSHSCSRFSGSPAAALATADQAALGGSCARW